MGANQSTPDMPKQKTLSSTIDYLAANYILTSNFQDLKNLTDPQYCKNLVILTSDVIQRYLTQQDIEFLKQRMEGSIEKNEMTTEKIAYFNKENLDKMDIKSDLRKKRMCIAIAKYYVQIFHIFNAIAHTINPVYTWKDKFGSTVSVDYEHRNEIPKDVQPTISKVNLCSSRINALMKDKSPLDGLKTPTNNIVELQSQFCDINTNKDGTTKLLSKEPGIPELEMLYYDVYDYNTGKFTTMSPDMLKQYNKDLQSFYTLFTGQKKIPSSIKKFGDIPLRDYNKAGPCSKPNGYFRKSYKGTLKEKLFQQYAQNVQTMMANTETNQKALLGIIDQLFVFIKDPQDPNKKLIVINPKLDNKLLSKLVADTRNLIIKLYATCEQDFFKGLQIFEALVEKQILDASTAQIKQLQQNVEETISIEGTPPALPPNSSGGPSVPPPPPGSSASGSTGSPGAPGPGAPVASGAPVGGVPGAGVPGAGVPGAGVPGAPVGGVPGTPGVPVGGVPGAPLGGPAGSTTPAGAPLGGPTPVPPGPPGAGAAGPPGGWFRGLFGRREASSTTGATSGTPASTTGATSGTPATTTGATSGSPDSTTGATKGTPASTTGATSVSPDSTTGATRESESTESSLPRAIPSEINMGPDSIMSPLTPMTPSVSIDSETVRSHNLPSVSTMRSAPGKIEGNKPTYEDDKDDETIVTDYSEGIPGATTAKGPATVG